MDAWLQLCKKAFDGDVDADRLILYVEHYGRSMSNGQFSVTTPSLTDADRACLQAIGFIPSAEQDVMDTVWTLPSDQWSHYLETRRTERSQWHELKYHQLRAKLYTDLATIQPLADLTDHHRLALVTKFSSRFAADPGAIPFLRGLVGFLRFQLFKDRLADWRSSEHIFTQNGEKAMLEYIKLLKGVLQLELVASDDNPSVVLDMRGGGGGGGGGSSATPDPVLIWRMNTQFSDHHLSDILAILPRSQNFQGFTLSESARPVQISASIGFYHPQFFFQWIVYLFRHYMGIISRTGRR